MHVIISHQQVIFTGLISFYKFFNDMYFTHVILLLRSKVGRYLQKEEWVPKNNPSHNHIKKGCSLVPTLHFGGNYPHLTPIKR